MNQAQPLMKYEYQQSIDLVNVLSVIGKLGSRSVERASCVLTLFKKTEKTL